jgi:hypothetical protein
MIAVQEAVEKAVAFACDVLEPARTRDVLLEEVELATFRGKEAWEITLSLPDPRWSFALGAHRQYKTFTVDSETGEVLSMKIRQLSGTA